MADPKPEHDIRIRGDSMGEIGVWCFTCSTDVIEFEEQMRAPYDSDDIGLGHISLKHLLKRVEEHQEGARDG